MTAKHDFKPGEKLELVDGELPGMPVGTIVTVVEQSPACSDQSVCYREEDGSLTWRPASFFARCSPVRTVTRLEPVEGKHGIVQLDVNNGQIVVTISPEDGLQPSGDALRSAAMILSQIAEYRDEVTK